MFCYVNSVFAPALDEGVGNLWRVSFLALFLFSLVVMRCAEWSVLYFGTGDLRSDFADSVGQCFKTGDELVVSYSVTQAFG